MNHFVTDLAAKKKYKLNLLNYELNFFTKIIKLNLLLIMLTFL